MAAELVHFKAHYEVVLDLKGAKGTRPLDPATHPNTRRRSHPLTNVCFTAILRITTDSPVLADWRSRRRSTSLCKPSNVVQRSRQTAKPPSDRPTASAT